KPLAQRAEQWLTSTGFPLEYRAARAIEGAGFNTVQGFHVEGDSPPNALEIDVIGSRGTAPVLFSLVVECKRIMPPTAWIALASSSAKAERWRPHGILRTPLAKELEKTRAGAFAGAEPEFIQLPFHALKTMRDQPKKGDPDENDMEPSFKAVQSLLRRAVAHDWHPNTMTTAAVKDTRTKLTIPVLVVDGELASAQWNAHHTRFEVQPVAQLWLDWWGYSSWSLKSADVAVVHIDGLPEFASRMKFWSDRWLAEMNAALDEQKRTEEAVATARQVAGQRDE